MSSMAIQEIGPMLTASEVAEMLHLHVNTVKRLGDRGELPFYHVCKRGDRRFRLDDVMAFLPHIRDWDEKGEVHREVFGRMGEQGFLGAPIPERYGGGGMDYISFALL